MTVKELIDKLLKMPQDSFVVIDGYEGGVDTISSCEIRKIKWNVNKQDYLGKHELDEDGIDTAVYID